MHFIFNWNGKIALWKTGNAICQVEICLAKEENVSSFHGI